ncbi:MAG: ribonuclease HII [Bacteroidia bacterium]|nr:ribonuclease HII [Bacteroidia bacterium]
MLKQFFNKGILEAGCDEAGRGCLAGPVIAAAVIFPEGFEHSLLDDSKKLSHTQRNKLRHIIEQNALTWSVGMANNQEIDDINILNASFLAMHRAISNLKVKAERLIIDGNRFNPYKDVPYDCIVKGDGKYQSIAAASILAKTHRDTLMEKLDSEYPNYHWKQNKGYPTKLHRKGIQDYGLSPYHRRSFKLLEKQLQLF